MSRKFQASVQRRDGVSYVSIAGVLDEDNELAALSDEIPPGMVVIDLGQISRINSFGVRDWVHWVEALEKNRTRIELVECSPAVVAQINLILGFTGQGLVRSFRVPYVCPACDVEKALLIEAAAMGPPPYQPPTCHCDACGGVMDFDDVPASYFAFLAPAAEDG